MQHIHDTYFQIKPINYIFTITFPELHVSQYLEITETGEIWLMNPCKLVNFTKSKLLNYS